MSITITRSSAVWMFAGTLALGVPASAQTPAAPPQHASDPAAAPAPQDDDAVFDPLQPDFTVTTIPTTLRLPKFKSAFRLTHRFARPLGQGDFGDLVSDFFGFDSGAQIGLEYRISLMRRSQVGIYRTSDKTIEFFGQYGAIKEGDRWPLSLDAVLAIEGTNNFRDEYSPAFGAVLSKRLETHAVVYAEPLLIVNTNLDPAATGDDNTLLLGLGARVRVLPTVYLVGEFQPRLAGFKPGAHNGSFGIEKRAGGHVFQLNFSNTLGTTPGQLARGGFTASDWHIGFNLTRRFF